jgi:hypothetical protein
MSAIGFAHSMWAESPDKASGEGVFQHSSTGAGVAHLHPKNLDEVSVSREGLRPYQSIIGAWVPVSHASEGMGDVIFSRDGTLRWKGCHTAYVGIPALNPDSIFLQLPEQGWCSLPGEGDVHVTMLRLRFKSDPCEVEMTTYGTYQDFVSQRPSFIGLFSRSSCGKSSPEME